jgi:choice-of-anchor A domain-containing protein
MEISIMTALKACAAAIALTFAAAGTAQAKVVDLGIGGANLFSLGAFSATNSDVEGAVLVAGSMSASNYSVNDKNKDAYSSNNGSGYSLAVGGALSYSNGSIKHGEIYVGGASVYSGVGLQSSTMTSVAPVNFTALQNSVKSTSANLAKLAATGTGAVSGNAMTLKGSSQAVEVFNLKGSDLSKIDQFSLSGLSKDATLIINVSGTDAIGFNQNGVSLSDFSKYNVVYNFYQSTAMNIQNVGIEGNLLAPLARVTGGNGNIDGEVIVGTWASNVQVNASNFFKPTSVAAYMASQVPEPETYAMLLAGLGLIGFTARRRKQAAAR